MKWILSIRLQGGITQRQMVAYAKGLKADDIDQALLNEVGSILDSKIHSTTCRSPSVMRKLMSKQYWMEKGETESNALKRCKDA